MVSKDDNISINKQCDLLGLNKSTFYYSPKGCKLEDLAIMKILDEQYLKTPFYGSRKVLEVLLAKCYNINIKRVRRLMKVINWQTIYPKKTTRVNIKAYKYPYLLSKLDINSTNQVWAIDITYIPMKKGFMYLFAIIDIYSRYVVGWSISNSMTTKWCNECIEAAIKREGAPGIINSDQGTQFTSKQYVDLLNNYGIKISMDSKGRYKDNIFIERLWRSVKYEHLYLYAYEDGLELWKGLNEYFSFYNNERFHQSLDNKRPFEIYKQREAA